MACRDGRAAIAESGTRGNKTAKDHRGFPGTQQATEHRAGYRGSARSAVKDTGCSRMPQRPGGTALGHTGNRCTRDHSEESKKNLEVLA